MDIFSRLKRFKVAKENFQDLPPSERAEIIHKWTGLPTSDAICLCAKEQGKLLFSAFYGACGEQLVGELCGEDETEVEVPKLP